MCAAPCSLGSWEAPGCAGKGKALYKAGQRCKETLCRRQQPLGSAGRWGLEAEGPWAGDGARGAPAAVAVPQLLCPAPASVGVGTSA